MSAFSFLYCNSLNSAAKQPDQQTQTDSNGVVANNLDPNENGPSKRPRRSRLFGRGPEPIPKQMRVVNGVKCPISKCTTHFTYTKNINRHLKQEHGEKLMDGSFGLIRYKCPHNGCSTEVINTTIIKNHQADQHENKQKKCEKIIYEIDETVEKELKLYFASKSKR